MGGFAFGDRTLGGTAPGLGLSVIPIRVHDGGGRGPGVTDAGRPHVAHGGVHDREVRVSAVVLEIIVANLSTSRAERFSFHVLDLDLAAAGF